MEGLFGAAFKDFVLVAADMTAAQSILVMKNGKLSLQSLTIHFHLKINSYCNLLKITS
jgi:hypothetical protein